jgi:hypothetical protein
MTEDTIKKGASFFDELSLRLQKENVEFAPPENNRLPILLEGREIGIVTAKGAMRVRPEYVDTSDAREVYHRAWAITEEVREYMELMQSAPTLKADGLNAPYKKLADFNGYVLGGKESKYGVQFTTWQWTYEKTGLALGHYHSNNFADAKKDFAIRSGLINKLHIFSEEQLTEMYRCAADTLETNEALTYEREKSIESVRKQIEDLLPDVAARVEQSMESDLRPPLSPTM